MSKNLFDPTLDNFNDTKRLNKRPKIIIFMVLMVFVSLICFVIFTAGNKEAIKQKAGLTVAKNDDSYNSDDDFVRNLADNHQRRTEEAPEIIDFRDTLVESAPSVSSRTEVEPSNPIDVSLPEAGFIATQSIPISMLDDNITIFDKDDTFASVHLTTSEILAFRQQRIDSVNEALRATTNVYRGDGTIVASTNAVTPAATNTPSQQPLSYQEQLEQALAPANANQNPDVTPAGDKWTLNSQLDKPNPYSIKTGAIIPATLITEVNSTIQGLITGQVRNNVYDTASGKHLLIPQGTRLVGTYGTEVSYGQSRLYVAWNRLVFPNGASLDIDVMPGADMSGKAGFNDKVNNHYLRIFGNALLLSLIVAGVNVSQRDLFNNVVPYYLEGSTAALSESLGQNLGETMSQMVRKNLNIAPELTIRSGYLFNIMVVKDITLPVYK